VSSRVVTEARLGRPLEESLDSVAETHAAQTSVGRHGDPHPTRESAANLSTAEDRGRHDDAA